MKNSIQQLQQEMTPWILLLQKYYQGHLCTLDSATWEEIIQALQAEPTATMTAMAEALEVLAATEEFQRQEMKYDFNNLFIGPDILKAPPYESCYLNPERTLMQTETMRVRAKYREAGLEVAKKNVEPDDFIGFELEFLLFLLSSESETHHNLIPQFMKEHLLVWYKPHLEAIRNNTQHPICLSMARILEGIMEYFNTMINHV